MSDFCIIKTLPDDQLLAAAKTAVDHNPANAPPIDQIAAMMLPALAVDDPGLTPQRIAIMTGKYWSNEGVDLTVGFMEPIPDDLKARILEHMNACGGNFANIRFRWSKISPQVRITRNDDGYWSYLGTDVLHIPANKPTMCLQGFTMQTPESEYRRVVRHETLHTCGAPHEHMRSEIVNRLDRAKTIAWGRSVLGWDEQTVVQQILTPLSESSLIGTTHADDDSIMTYQLPASITKDGLPIIGGKDITANDRAFLAKVYPLAIQPPPGPTDPTSPTLCESVRLALKVFNYVRHQQERKTMQELQLTDQERATMNALGDVCKQLPWLKVIQSLLGACPTGTPANPTPSAPCNLAALVPILTQLLPLFCPQVK